ncbi:MAG: FKBP-type peptidyl-prolyl cis-trans isomerase [Psychroflexus sp.]
MKVFRIPLIVMTMILLSCSSDDDSSGGVQTRDPEIVKDENLLEIEGFLETHFYEFQDNPENPNFQKIVFDTIDGENSGRTPIMNSELLESKTVVQQDIEYKLYYLKLREGAEPARQPKFADSTFVTYNGRTLDKRSFDNAPNPIWFDLPNTVRGFYEVMEEFRGSTGFVENPDGTVDFNDDFGIGAVFIPSGIAYFATPPQGSGIRSYDPLIFSFQLYRSKESDHDQDGVPTWMEDENGNRRVTDDDTDNDRNQNYIDTDDDGDGVPTSEEIEFDEDGNLVLPDSNGNGTPDYLDETYPE